MKKRLVLLLGFILALISLFVFAGDISIPIPDHKGKIHVIIDVRSEGGTPLPGVTVDLFGTAYYTGNPSSQYRKTDMYEVQTDQNGSIDMLIASWDSPGKIIINDQSQDARGSYLTARAYAPDYRQLTQGDTFFAADNSAPLNYVNQITIKMKSFPAGTKNTLYGVGLRESLYGLTRPYGDMAFYFNKPPLNQRPDKYMHYPTPDQTNNFVQHLSQRVTVNGLQPQKNMHVVIVTQTDPGTFIEGRRGGGWGPTYLLWNETDPNSGSDTKPENVKFLDDVHDLYGRYFDGSDQNLLNWYNVDQILSKYDQDLDAEVYIQIESGNVNIYWILEAVYNRFCNPALGQNHPCVKGFGIDTEWYNNVDPFDAKESDIISKSLGNHILAFVKGLNPQYRLFLKHWSPTAISNECFKDIIYVDDTQGAPCLLEKNNPDKNKWNSIEKDYGEWAATYSPADIVFQGFYDSAAFESCDPNIIPEEYQKDQRGPRDSRWWATFQNPLQDTFKLLFEKKSAIKVEPGRRYSVIWVDFSARSDFSDLASLGDTVAQGFKCRNVDSSNDMLWHVTPPPFNGDYVEECSPPPPPPPPWPNQPCQAGSLPPCPTHDCDYPSLWQFGTNYNIGDEVYYQRRIWVCTIAHNSAGGYGWCPGTAPSLWKLK